MLFVKTHKKISNHRPKGWKNSYAINLILVISIEKNMCSWSCEFKTFLKIFLKILIDRVGSSLGPVLANLFMSFYEKQWLKEFNFCKVLLYRRYVDDIICLFSCEVDAIKVFDYLDSRHPNIKLAFKKQNGGKLAFLDILISNESDNFCTSVFRKRTSIGLSTLTLPVLPLFRIRLG